MIKELYRHKESVILGVDEALFSDMTQFVDAGFLTAPGTFLGQRSWFFETDDYIVPGLIPKNFGHSTFLFSFNNTKINAVDIVKEFSKHLGLVKEDRINAILNTKRKVVESFNNHGFEHLVPMLDPVGRSNRFTLSFMNSKYEDERTYVKIELAPDYNIHNTLDVFTSIATIQARKAKYSNPETPFVQRDTNLDVSLRAYIRFCKEVLEADALFLYSQFLYVMEQINPDIESNELMSFKNSWVSLTEVNLYWKDCVRVKADGLVFVKDKKTGDNILGFLKEHVNFLPKEIDIDVEKDNFSEMNILKEFYSVDLL